MNTRNSFKFLFTHPCGIQEKGFEFCQFQDKNAPLCQRTKMSRALCCEMNRISDTKIAHRLCGCVELPPVIAHNESDIQMTAVPNMPSTKFGKIPLSGADSCLMPFHMCHSVKAVSQLNFAISVFVLILSDLQKLSFDRSQSPSNGPLSMPKGQLIPLWWPPAL